MRKSSEDRHYIDNKQFLGWLQQYHRLRKEYPDYRIPDTIGKAIYLISENLGKRWNFRDYTYIDEMKSDAIEDCIAAVNNFDSERFSNPLAYFTQIAWYAFLQRIAFEKKQQFIKHKNFQNLHLFDCAEASEQWGEIGMSTSELSDKVIEEFEESLMKKTLTKQTNGGKTLVGKKKKTKV